MQSRENVGLKVDYMARCRDGELIHLALDRDGRWDRELGRAGVWGSMDACTEP